MKTPHKHYKLMADYAQDAAETETPWERWEYTEFGAPWMPLAANPSWAENREYRRKPKTININGFEVPEPMREKPENGTKYWRSFIYDKEQPWGTQIWAGDSLDFAWLTLGLCHTTRESAELHAKALLSFTKQPE